MGFMCQFRFAPFKTSYFRLWPPVRRPRCVSKFLLFAAPLTLNFHENILYFFFSLSLQFPWDFHYILFVHGDQLWFGKLSCGVIHQSSIFLSVLQLVLTHTRILFQIWRLGTTRVSFSKDLLVCAKSFLCNTVINDFVRETSTCKYVQIHAHAVLVPDPLNRPQRMPESQ